MEELWDEELIVGIVSIVGRRHMVKDCVLEDCVLENCGMENCGMKNYGMEESWDFKFLG